MGDAQKALFQKIANNKLEVPYTWEVRLTQAGQNGESKKVVWEELITSGKIGYMALLRNLRNILEVGVSRESVRMICDYLSSKKAVLKSKQLPFRFLSAYRMITTGAAPDLWDKGSDDYNKNIVNSPNLGMVIEALEQAIIHSTHNIPIFEGENILIATDVSGSMCYPVSPHSVIQNYDIGAVLAMLVHFKAKSSVTGIFGDIFRVYPFPKRDILRNAEKVYELEGKVGYSTHGFKVIQYANQAREELDRILIFTDCQMYGGNDNRISSAIQREWNIYKTRVPHARLYLFDLAGYGTTPVSILDNDINLIAGWSDKVFDVMNALENGETALDKIRSIQL